MVRDKNEPQTKGENKMKKYLAIGHFKGSENMTSVAELCNSRDSFKSDLRGNAFVAYAIISESKMEALKASIEDPLKLFDEAKKLTSNYRIWNDLCDYIEQCFDIMQERMEAAE